MFNLIYTSQVEQLLNESELFAILAESYKWNSTNGITGMLLYVQGHFVYRYGGRFIQVLEGAEVDVMILFSKIKADHRHHDLIILQQGTIKGRNFKNWSMGFKSISLEDYRKIPGFFELDNTFPDRKLLKKFNMPLVVLKSFYDMHVIDNGCSPELLLP